MTIDITHQLQRRLLTTVIYKCKQPFRLNSPLTPGENINYLIQYDIAFSLCLFNTHEINVSKQTHSKLFSIVFLHLYLNHTTQIFPNSFNSNQHGF